MLILIAVILNLSNIIISQLSTDCIHKYIKLFKDPYWYAFVLFYTVSLLAFYIFQSLRYNKYFSSEKKYYLYKVNVYNINVFQYIISRLILADYEYFKSSKRNYLLFVRSIYITINLSFSVYFLSKIMSTLSIGKMNLEDCNSFKIAVYTLGILVTTYWNLKNDQNKKFEYALTEYNKIHLKNKNSFLTTTLAMDILTMDLHTKRILAPFFWGEFSDAYKHVHRKDFMPLKPNDLLTESETYEILKEYAIYKKNKKSFVFHKK